MARSRWLILGAIASLLICSILWVRSSGEASQILPPQHFRLVIKTAQGERAQGERAQGDRECVIHLPPGYDPSQPTPLVIMLHGFGGTALMAAR